jgi:4'-phosphopantetheinyl transferase
MEPGLALPENEVHVWHLPLGQVAQRDLERCYDRLLTPDERQRCERFAFERDRRQFLAGRSLLRIVLSKYAAIPPDLWRFRVNDYGKPAIESPATGPDLWFSVTHTSSVAAVAVAAGFQVGVDAECVSRSTDWQTVAENYFAPEEWIYLTSLSDAEQRAGFFRVWTLKEALLKAVGQGLSIPLNAFRFEFPVGLPPQVQFSRALPNRPEEWRFWLFTSPPDHQFAVAVAHPSSRRPTLVVNLADLRFDGETASLGALATEFP